MAAIPEANSLACSSPIEGISQNQWPTPPLAVQMLLKLALQSAHDDYQDRRERQRQGVELAKAAGKYRGRKTDTATHQRVIAFRNMGKSIAETAKLAACSKSQVKRVWAMRNQGSTP
jgi:DNA invertase Pin-like site-specific DNA recombinase